VPSDLLQEFLERRNCFHFRESCPDHGLAFDNRQRDPAMELAQGHKCLIEVLHELVGIHTQLEGRQVGGGVIAWNDISHRKSHQKGEHDLQPLSFAIRVANPKLRSA